MRPAISRPDSGTGVIVCRRTISWTSETSTPNRY
jgi:hypothetical protein